MQEEVMQKALLRYITDMCVRGMLQALHRNDKFIIIIIMVVNMHVNNVTKWLHAKYKLDKNIVPFRKIFLVLIRKQVDLLKPKLSLCL
jgi:hypothetical protein